MKPKKGAHAYYFPDRRRLAESLARSQAWQLLSSFCVPFLFPVAFWNSRVLNLYEVYLIYLLFVFLTQYHEDLLLPLLRAFMVLNTKLRAMILTKFIFVCGIRQAPDSLHGKAVTPVTWWSPMLLSPFWKVNWPSTSDVFPALASHRILLVFLPLMKSSHWQLYWLITTSSLWSS